MRVGFPARERAATVLRRSILLLGFAGWGGWLPGTAAAPTYAPPAAGDYGGAGPFEVFTENLVNPVYPTANGRPLTVSIHHPHATLNPSLPTVFFAHGFTSPVGDPASYGALLANLASRGYNVVFSPYEGGAGLNIAMRFDEMVTGFVAAAANHGLNTAQVGFVGHSYGAGFLPAVVRHLMMGQASQFRPGKTWGGTAAFLFSMAPGYAFSGGGQTGVNATQAITFPAHLNAIVQVYFDDETVNDPRVATDIFHNLTTSNARKAFFTVYGDDHGTPVQVANHFLPNTSGGVSSTSLQAWAILRPLQALADFTFTGNPAAHELALGDGTAEQTYTGVWSDSSPVKPVGVTDLPVPASFPPSSGYGAVVWTSPVNPRGAFPLTSEGPKIGAVDLAVGQVSLQVEGLLPGHLYRLQTSTDLSAGGWSDAEEFTATQVAQTLTTAAPTTALCFWRVIAP